MSDTLLCDALANVRRKVGRPTAVGLCGSQGSGKSTTATRIACLLRDRGYAVAVCSLDDFYLTHQERLSLAAQIHPLLATRGVPGTHDIALLQYTIGGLLAAEGSTKIPLPSFDKASDERRVEADWSHHIGKVDIVILEGWCVGARPQDETLLGSPINELEQQEDREGHWRRFVNDRLREDYAPIFKQLDFNLMLRAPSFSCVQAWRAEQERGLKRDDPTARAAMNSEELSRFIAHYERLTLWLLQDEPADLIADLDEERVPFRWRIGDSGQGTTEKLNIGIRGGEREHE